MKVPQKYSNCASSDKWRESSAPYQSPNIVYIMRKELDGDRIRDILEILSIIFRISDLKADDLKKAAEMNFRDYEDALQNVCAERMKADYIITRNKRDFAGSKVPAFSPEEFLEIDAPVNTC